LEAEEKHGGYLRRGCAGHLHAGFRHGEGQQAISDDRQLGIRLFNYDAKANTFTADAAPADCGSSCHVSVKTKDYIFYPYEMR
jgi:hypothetical protein